MYYLIQLKYSSITRAKTVSTPHIANENIIEKTATSTVRLCPSAQVGQLTLFLSSPNDSFTYSTIPAIVL